MTAARLTRALRDARDRLGPDARWHDLTPEQLHFRARVAKAKGARLYSYRNDRGLWDSTLVVRQRRAD